MVIGSHGGKYKMEDMIEEMEEDPNIDRKSCEIVGYVKDGCGCSTIERLDINPYEAVKVLLDYLIKKQMSGINKSDLN